MFAVRFHGRGGQGVVTAAGLLASAAFREGRYAQASASFGQERTGAPNLGRRRGKARNARTCLAFRAVALRRARRGAP
jgi:pyruvate ferredoxin oxidoreductase gamma subunit